ncbi:MAG: spore cortex-lytic protein [Ruminococcaceae bacterium]|nr:spore cortex-lytic protein [Oscillospiraceae bacterium]
MNVNLPFIPETVTVHLGSPSSNAENVTLPFVDYIANVASSEIYPTWPENAIRANIYAQISYTLNRIYTEYYRSQGYDFDITNSTAFDQSFVKGRDIFENVYQIVSEIFNDYISRRGNVEPLFAQYCDGVEVTCGGLSQWGSVELANRGYTPYEILTYYYGNDIDIVTDAPVQSITESVPERPLRLGNVGNDVRSMQIRLNRISDNYPSIPKIALPDGYFSFDTEEAVKQFQRVFSLTPDGIVGKATWYRIQFIYNAVKKLNELNSEGITLSEVTDQFDDTVVPGSSGVGVAELQYLLDYLSAFYEAIPSVNIDGIYGPATESAVRSAQRLFGLPETGIFDLNTWEAIYRTYLGFIETIPVKYVEGNTIPYPGVPLRLGASSDSVSLLQEYLNYISDTFTEIPSLPVTGYFGSQTDAAVRAFQELFGITPTGTVGATTWFAITSIYSDLYNGSRLGEGQYPGFETGR